ncbi:hypothetical protein Vi05172_g12728 [Venturia inaequalis]|nr:hypothetical protein Vi05172_g12728 [Venturia inaequalis]
MQAHWYYCGGRSIFISISLLASRRKHESTSSSLLPLSSKTHDATGDKWDVEGRFRALPTAHRGDSHRPTHSVKSTPEKSDSSSGLDSLDPTVHATSWPPSRSPCFESNLTGPDSEMGGLTCNLNIQPPTFNPDEQQYSFTGLGVTTSPQLCGSPRSCLHPEPRIPFVREEAHPPGLDAESNSGPRQSPLLRPGGVRYAFFESKLLAQALYHPHAGTDIVDCFGMLSCTAYLFLDRRIIW